MAVFAAQSRAARALLGWSQDDLSQRSKVAKTTIATFEAGRTNPYGRTLDDLQEAFERAGVTFDMAKGNGDGVRFTERTDSKPSS